VEQCPKCANDSLLQSIGIKQRLEGYQADKTKTINNYKCLKCGYSKTVEIEIEETILAPSIWLTSIAVIIAAIVTFIYFN